MGTHDTPAVIKHIQETTGYAKINYIGHSEGTSQIMAGAGLKPYNKFYSDSLNLAVFLAPPACMSFNTSEIYNLLNSAASRKILTDAINLTGQYNLLPYNFLTSGSAQILCKLFDGKLCDLLLKTAADADPDIDNTDMYAIMTKNLPAGASYRNTLHYAQLMDLPYQEFLRWDYGREGNIKNYGQETPPAYDLSLLDFPLAILSGSKDKMADPLDVKWTSDQLKNTTIFNHEYYLGHISFAIAKDMSWFDVDVMAIMNHYNGKCSPSTLNSNFTVGNEKCKEELSN